MADSNMTENLMGSPKGPENTDPAILSLEETLRRGNVAFEVCMDEALRVKGDGIFIIGTPGTFVTTREDNPGYPRSVKEVVERVRPFFNGAIKKIGDRLGIKSIFTTSHEGCGALALQGVTGSRAVKEVSEKFVADNSDCPPYLTHIAYRPKDDFPDEIPGPPIEIYIKRPEDNHLHVARGVIFTTGGFAKFEEFRELKDLVIDGAEVLKEPGKEIDENPEFTDYFIVSADWLHEALKDGASPEDLKKVMTFINDLTKKIMQNTLKQLTNVDQPLPQLEIIVFNAGRLGEDGQKNTELLKSYLSLD